LFDLPGVLRYDAGQNFDGQNGTPAALPGSGDVLHLSDQET
jgi:hypothetical protein